MSNNTAISLGNYTDTAVKRAYIKVKMNHSYSPHVFPDLIRVFKNIKIYNFFRWTYFNHSTFKPPIKLNKIQKPSKLKFFTGTIHSTVAIS